MKSLKIIFSLFLFSLIFMTNKFETVDRLEKLVNVIEFGHTKNMTKKMKLLDERLKMNREKKLSVTLDKFFEGMPDCYLDVTLDIVRNKANDLKAKSIPAMQNKIKEIRSEKKAFLPYCSCSFWRSKERKVYW